MYHIKNKMLKITIPAMLLLGVLSCKKALDKNPLDQISSPTFWKTQTDADMALAGCYARLNTPAYKFNQIMWSILAGDASEANQSLGAASVGTLAQGTITSTSGGLVSDIYTQSYVGIGSCNFFLENIDKVPISEEIKTQYKAEVRFLRALFYFTVSDFYGGVPLITKSVTIEEAKTKQATKDEIMAQVLSDLDDAIANLPNTDYSTAGHAVKGSALALKSRVLLFKQDWPGAAAAAKQVIDDGKFSLYNNFKTLFLASGQNNNPEVIFSTRFLNPDNFSDQDIQLQWWGVINPRQELVDAFECKDGLPISTSPLYDEDNWKANRDPRLLMTVKAFADPAVKASGQVVPYSYNAPSSTGYEPNKFIDVEHMPIDYATKSEQDWILIRYAEVLLNYAEAQNEASGPDQSVYDAINAIRDRPGVDMPPIPTGLTKEQMRARIWQERRVELALEGQRYGDIKRWKLAETYIPTLTDLGGVQRKFDPAKNYVFPFPQSEIDVNPSLEQNPNY